MISEKIKLINEISHNDRKVAKTVSAEPNKWEAEIHTSVCYILICCLGKMANR